MNYFLQGFVLGIAYVAPIGMQNMYVINSALVKKRGTAYQVAFITVFFDIALALACFFGMGLIMAQSQFLKGSILLIGSIAVIYIGISLMRSTPQMSENVDVNKSFIQIASIIFAVTWLNPQALIDGSLLLGGVKASLPVDVSVYFISGVAFASLTWFVGLTTVITAFKKNFNNRILKAINSFSGTIIILYGIKLGWNFIQMLTV